MAVSLHELLREFSVISGKVALTPKGPAHPIRILRSGAVDAVKYGGGRHGE